jgi:hypothetical protein
MKAHRPDMVAAWAKENGIKGYEMYDKVVQEKNRMRAMKARRKDNEESERNDR